MTVQEIFNTKAVQEIETEILTLQYETEKRKLFRDYEGVAIERLLRVRRNILNGISSMNISSWMNTISSCYANSMKL